MRIKLPQYSGKDYLVLALILLPFTFIVNFAIFGGKYFSGSAIFITASLITATVFALYFILCSSIAVFLKSRFQQEEDSVKRLGIMIFILLLLTGFVLLSLFRGYEALSLFDYSFNKTGFVWAYTGLGIINIFLTFLFEGIARFQSWKANLKATGELEKAYQQSQLQGLKSQVNPHFLFNSLNSLSSLIHEDEDAAEAFLNEMSKVYRYMLRNDDEQLVMLADELRFLASYEHLLTARYGEGLSIRVETDEASSEQFLPPLTLQVIIENTFTQNTLSKANPLVITIRTAGNQLIIKNNVQPKMLSDSMDFETGLDNLVKKYQLLNRPAVVIESNDKERVIRLPLITSQREAV